MTQQQTRAQQREDAKADAKRVARDTEKEDLLFQLATLSCRLDALKAIYEDRKARLETLMSEDGDRVRGSAHGSASFGSTRSLKIVDPIECAKRFTKPVLVKYFRPPVTFYEACVKAQEDVNGVFVVGVEPTFTFERARTKAAQEFKKKVIEESKAAAEAAIEEMVATLRSQKNER